jgi:hypothetical protein
LLLPFAGFYGGGSAILSLFQQRSIRASVQPRSGWKAIQSITLNH